MSRAIPRTLALLSLAACLAFPAEAALFPSLPAPSDSPPPEESSETKSESRELIFEIINFVILAGALGYLLREPVSGFFAGRSWAIRHSIEEGRKALAASEAEVRKVEEKFAQLEGEIEAFREKAAREIAAERDRLRADTKGEAKKLLEFAQARLDAATRAARQELRAFTADQALELAEQTLHKRLDAPRQERLFSRYLEGLARTSLASRN